MVTASDPPSRSRPVTCERAGCTGETSGDLRYCSDNCLHADQDFGTPVTVLARNKAGGFGRGLAWAARRPVAIPPIA